MPKRNCSTGASRSENPFHGAAVLAGGGCYDAAGWANDVSRLHFDEVDAVDRLLRSYSLLLAQSVLLAALAAAPVFAHDGDDHEHPVPAKPEATYRPSSVPDRICLCLTEQPATSMAVTWRTDEKTSKAIAQLAPAAGGPGFTKSAVSVEGATQRLESNLGPAHFHEARFTDLEPKSKYLYRVGDGVNWSEWAEFETASESSEPFSFVYFGDAQNDIKSHWSRVVRNAFRGCAAGVVFPSCGRPRESCRERC